MRYHSLLRSRLCGFAFAVAMGAVACSSDDTSSGPASSTAATGSGGAAGSSGSGGKGGAGGASGGGTAGGTSAGGASGTGGSSSGSAGNGGSGGATGGAGGTAGSAGTAGNGGAGGGSGGKGGAGGTAGNGGATNDGGPADGGGSDASSAMTLTSTAFAEGAVIPPAHVCAMGVSPPLSWTPGPSGTMSYAIVLYDRTATVWHWALWDIPSSTTSLPQDLPKMSTLSMPSGAKQNGYNASGYAGPCPPDGGGNHTYEFTVYALGTAPQLSGMTTSQGSDKVHMNETRIQNSQVLAKATLTGHVSN